VIIGGSDKEILEFYLAKKPQVNLISKKEVLENLKILFKTLISLFNFLPLTPKEKSLYNTPNHKNVKNRRFLIMLRKALLFRQPETGGVV